DVYTAVASPLTYNDGTWHHAAGILRSGLAELYVDGVLVAQDMTNPIASVRSSTQTVIGHVASDFVGDIDEVRIFSSALMAAEIAALVPPPPPPVNGLILSYDMETFLSNGRVKDLSGQGHHGTMTGTTDIAGRSGRAIHFSGGERIYTAVVAYLADFTISAIVNW